MDTITRTLVLTEDGEWHWEQLGDDLPPGSYGVTFVRQETSIRKLAAKLLKDWDDNECFASEDFGALRSALARAEEHDANVEALVEAAKAWRTVPSTLAKENLRAAIDALDALNEAPDA